MEINVQPYFTVRDSKQIKNGCGYEDMSTELIHVLFMSTRTNKKF